MNRSRLEHSRLASRTGARRSGSSRRSKLGANNRLSSNEASLLKNAASRPLRHNSLQRRVTTVTIPKRLAHAVLAFVCLGLTPGAQAKNCKTGQPCGNSCISWSKTCRIGSGGSGTSYVAPRSSSPAPAPAPQTSTDPKSTLAPAPAAPPVISKLPAGSSETTRTMRVDGAAFEWPAFEAPVVAHVKAGTVIPIYRRHGQWVRMSPDSAPTHQWVYEAVLHK